MERFSLYIDGHTLKEKVFPSSRQTRWRLMNRDNDPFPKSFKIGGKNFWETAEVIDWLARQKMKAA